MAIETTPWTRGILTAEQRREVAQRAPGLRLTLAARSPRGPFIASAPRVVDGTSDQYRVVALDAWSAVAGMLEAVEADRRVAGARWLAGADGIAHAHARGRSIATTCGRTPVDERWAWPVRERCGPCVAAIAGAVPIG